MNGRDSWFATAELLDRFRGGHHLGCSAFSLLGKQCATNPAERQKVLDQDT